MGAATVGAFKLSRRAFLVRVVDGALEASLGFGAVEGRVADALAFEALEDLALELCAVSTVANAGAVGEDLLKTRRVRYRHFDERGGLAGFLVNDADRAEGMLVTELAESSSMAILSSTPLMMMRRGVC